MKWRNCTQHESEVSCANNFIINIAARRRGHGPFLSFKRECAAYGCSTRDCYFENGGKKHFFPFHVNQAEKDSDVTNLVPRLRCNLIVSLFQNFCKFCYKNTLIFGSANLHLFSFICVSDTKHWQSPPARHWQSPPARFIMAHPCWSCQLRKIVVY